MRAESEWGHLSGHGISQREGQSAERPGSLEGTDRPRGSCRELPSGATALATPSMKAAAMGPSHAPKYKVKDRV
jgi:hypothetical protein